MKNKMLERRLFTAVGMSNVLLKQAEGLMKEISELKKIYSIEDLEKSSEKLLEVSKKICETKRILNRKESNNWKKIYSKRQNMLYITIKIWA